MDFFNGYRSTAQKVKFPIKDFLSFGDQIHNFRSEILLRLFLNLK